MGRRNRRNKNRKNKSKTKNRFLNDNTKSVVPSSEPDVPKTAAVVKELKQINRGKPIKLRFSPTAWSKLLYLRDIGNTEVGGFGITLKDDPLYVYDFSLIAQESSGASVDFKDEDVADFAMDMAEAGFEPAQFMRIWIHTHPNMSAEPSGTDEETFARAFGGCDWAVMAIVSKSNDEYCRIQLNSGPISGVYMEIPIEIDYTTYDFYASDSEKWAKEYKNKVTKKVWAHTYGGGAFKYTGRANSVPGPHASHGHMGWDEWEDYAGDGMWDNYNGFEWEEIDSPSAINVAKSPAESDDDEDEDAKYIKDMSVVSTDNLVIPDDLENEITANELTLLEGMGAYEKYTLIREIRARVAEENKYD